MYKVDWTGLPNILDNQVFETTMQYDALGRATEIELPKDVTNARKKITPTYNKAGGLEKVSFDGTTYVENIAYDAKGQRVLIAFGNGIMTRYANDKQTFRLKRQKSEKYVKTISGNTITYTPQAGSTKQDDGFDYDLVGNIMKILHRTTDCGIAGTVLGNDALDRVFTYDPLNRLLTASGRESDTQSSNNFLYDEAPIPGSPNANHVRAYNRTYSYDKLGNVQQVKQLGNNGFTWDFTYAANKNTLTKIEDTTPALLESYTYDANGNQLSTSLTRSYTWNHADQIVGFTGSNTLAQYDYSGQDRVSKFVKTGNDFERTIYIDGVFEYHILEKPSAAYEKNYVHVMDDSSRIAEVRIGQQFPNDISDSVVYNLETEIGSSTVRLDNNGTVIDKEEYYPFGDSSLRTFTYKRYRYVGKERDRESGLYYYGARYYSAWTCRFVSVDPLAGDYMYMTPYNYANNNPINDYDIDGQQDTQSKTDNSSGGNQGNHGQNGTRDNTTTKNIQVDQTVLKDIQIANASGLSVKEAKAERKYEELSKANINSPKAEIYGANDSKFWLTQSNYYPEMANYVATQNLMAKQKNGFMVFSVWFNGIGSPMIASFGVGEKTTTQPKIVTERVNFSGLKLSSTINAENSLGIGSNIKKTTSVDGLYTTFTSLTNRLSGLKDYKAGAFEIRYFGSRVNGKYRSDSDLDILILTYSPESFKEGTRLGKILESIKTDFKNQYGFDLDINIMTKLDYARTQGGNFKKVVDENSFIIKYQ